MNTDQNNGFTLVELMVTLLVAGIVLGVGIPAFSQFISTNRMAAAVNDVTTSLHLARTEAVKRRANVTVCPSANWDSAAPACSLAGNMEDGWITFVDCTVQPPPAGTCGAPNFTVDAFDTVVAVHGPLPDDIANNFSTNPGAPQYVLVLGNRVPAPESPSASRRRPIFSSATIAVTPTSAAASRPGAGFASRRPAGRRSTVTWPTSKAA